ncbi:hypothetical protein Ciccas_007881 [Cichlidogyrus casuarinus]|uniref:Uncharacterized protein n=1 Tax=Cichlidogyrus casuarinus TaxID=1844966 RepID=A0ABD2Q2A1_9PLAT
MINEHCTTIFSIKSRRKTRPYSGLEDRNDERPAVPTLVTETPPMKALPECQNYIPSNIREAVSKASDIPGKLADEVTDKCRVM